MYSKDDIMELIQAGFTPDQIVALSSKQAPDAFLPSQSPEPEQPQAPAVPEQPEPAPAPAPAPENAPKGATMDDVLAGITALNANMQKSMLQNSSQPNGGQPQTAESILAQIINPSYPTSFNNGGTN